MWILERPGNTTIHRLTTSKRYTIISDTIIRGVFRIQSNIYDEAFFCIYAAGRAFMPTQDKKSFFLQKQLTARLRIWSHLLKKSLMENFIFCVV